MQMQETGLWSDEEDTLNDEDYQEYFAEIEAQKDKDLEIVNEDINEEEE